jgi:hypothetical protein
MTLTTRSTEKKMLEMEKAHPNGACSLCLAYENGCPYPKQRDEYNQRYSYKML